MDTAPHPEAPATGCLPFPPPPMPPAAPEAYREFWELWRHEQFFACHEVLEGLWRQTSGRRRWFYQGLINCAVAVYQHRRGNAVGAARQLARAQTRLLPFAPGYYKVDVDGLLAGLAFTLESSLQQLDSHQRAAVSQVRRAVARRMEAEFKHGSSARAAQRSPNSATATVKQELTA